MASGIINGNSLFVTALGTFDYLKNFLAIFIYAAFFRDFNEFKKLFRLLLFIALLLGTVALIQFIWAMGSVYISGKDITDQSVYILFSRPKDSLEIAWRYGIFRTTSLTCHANLLGLFNLLIFTIYFHTEKRTNIKIYVPLLSGVLLSVSRMAYGGLIAIVAMEIMKRKKWFLLILVFMITFALLQVNFGDNFNLPGFLKSLSSDNRTVSIAHDIRGYSRNKSLEIWEDHPLGGVGPGMFGGIISFKYHSYINELYNLRSGYLEEQAKSIEQFWFQILTEMGIVGVLLFINLIVFLFIALYKLKEQTMSQDMKNLFSGLIVFIPCILIYTIGSGINIAPVLFTYCAFVGMGLGSSGLRGMG